MVVGHLNTRVVCAQREEVIANGPASKQKSVTGGGQTATSSASCLVFMLILFTMPGGPQLANQEKQ